MNQTFEISEEDKLKAIIVRTEIVQLFTANKADPGMALAVLIQVFLDIANAFGLNEQDRNEMFLNANTTYSAIKEKKGTS